jgi:bifunctional UDP-N-acetylglucosamine pyrophosphorylase/glucosamine-1-phosphate N-acetyltransferase
MYNTDKNIEAVVLAAGKSSRFNTEQSKLVTKICGQEMILYITKLLNKLNIPTTLIVGYQKEKIQEIILEHHDLDIKFVEQLHQLGTGHAVKTVLPYLSKDHVLVLNGDIPSIDQNIIDRLTTIHLENNASLSFVGAYNFDPNIKGYGTIHKDEHSIKIVEAKELKNQTETSEIPLLNAGIYLFEKNFLIDSISKLEKSSITGEIYITDLVAIANKLNKKIELVEAPFDKIRGVNTLQELWMVEQIIKAELIRNFMDQGVRFASGQNVSLDIDVSIGAGSFIGNGVELLSGAKIGKNSSINAYSIIKNSTLEDNVTIESHSIVENSTILANSQIGPFVHISSNLKPKNIGKYAINMSTENFPPISQEL